VFGRVAIENVDPIHRLMDPGNGEILPIHFRLFLVDVVICSAWSWPFSSIPHGARVGIGFLRRIFFHCIKLIPLRVSFSWPGALFLSILNF